MQYRQFGKLDFKVSALGFGAMRMPTIGGDPKNINEPEAIKMIRTAIDNGVNYVDTAYVYHGGMSEVLVGKALKDGYREKTKVATKLPVWELKTEADFDRLLDEQLGRLDIDAIDFYLLHALDKERWENLLKMNVFEHIRQYKASGKVKHIGFSFHDDAETFIKIVDAYDWDFCQIQYNFMDTENQAGLKGLEHAAEKNIAVIVMEPLRGGSLTKQPPEVVTDLWDQADVKRTPAEWALKWVWNHPGVSVVLSGMSTMEQVNQNLKYADESGINTMTPKELELVSKVKSAYESLIKVGCTGCSYCMPCPFGVNIPGNFGVYNEAFMFSSDIESKKNHYNHFMDASERASACQECGACEAECPQHLPIRELLKDVDKLLAAR